MFLDKSMGNVFKHFTSQFLEILEGAPSFAFPEPEPEPEPEPPSTTTNSQFQTKRNVCYVNN